MYICVYIYIPFCETAAQLAHARKGPGGAFRANGQRRERPALSPGATFSAVLHDPRGFSLVFSVTSTLHMYMRMCIHMSVHVYIYIYIHICRLVNTYINMSSCLSVCLPVCLSICLCRCTRDVAPRTLAPWNSKKICASLFAVASGNLAWPQ